MATLNFPDAPSTGDVYKDGNSGFSYEWNGTVWISKDPSTVSNIREIDNISSGFNGSTTGFTLQVSSVNVEPANVQQLIISVGGVMQNAGTDFTLSGSTLTFTTAPTAGLTFFGVLLGTALSLNTVADGTVGASSFEQPLTIGDGNDSTTIPGNAVVSGILTAANAYVTGILTAQTLNYNNVVDIYSTGIITATKGIQQTGNEGLNVTAGITTVGIFTATKAVVALGVTLNNTGIDVGIGAGIVTANSVKGMGANFSGGTVYSGKIVGTAATIGTGVTINNTGIDAGIGAGIVTAASFVGALTGNVTGTASGNAALTGSTNNTVVTVTGANAIAGEATLTYNGTDTFELQPASATPAIFVGDSNRTGAGQHLAEYRGNWNGTQVARIVFKAGDDTTNKDDGVITFYTTESGGSSTERLEIDNLGGFKFSNGLFDENVKITAGKLSGNTNIDLENGMVHYFTTQESTTATPNIRINSSTSLNSVMDTGNVCTVTLITTAAAAGYSANLTIDGSAVTEEWVGGAAPSAGSGDNGLDIYTYTIIKTGSGAYTVIANLTYATN